ncbi:MAG: type II toxin-antitoxin system RelE/ParE family toxin [bacterium]
MDKKLMLLVSGHQNLDIKKLINYKHPTYLLRVGIYRVIYEVHENKIVVVVIGIDHRKDAYK